MEHGPKTITQFSLKCHIAKFIITTITMTANNMTMMLITRSRTMPKKAKTTKMVITIMMIINDGCNTMITIFTDNVFNLSQSVYLDLATAAFTSVPD